MRRQVSAPGLVLAVLALLVLGAAPPVWAQEPPDGEAIVLRVHRETGDLINRDSTAFTDMACSALAATDPRWGRKVRRDGDWASRNADAIAYRFDTHKRMVDIVGSSSDPGGPPSPNARPRWDVRPLSEDNGYWMACQPVTPPPGDPPTDPPVDPPAVPPTGPTLGEALEQLRTQLEVIALKVDALSAQVAALPASRPWPTYRGSIPWLGTVTLTPEAAK